MTQRQFFFIFIMRSKGRERNGGRMLASEFGDRSPAQHGTGQMITSFKVSAWLVPVAFSAAAFRATIPNH